ncbi:hypothetical protein C8N46_11128 [Kordia periserrulae]|uniref:Uncharacterized protein n=1 Tax=Kordia periserrulae TaxID=701523 RepID=A0A2T6BSD6_9FLAO|nr:hypothetical protein C8N46_11128 [Kordia periserrulae]
MNLKLKLNSNNFETSNNEQQKTNNKTKMLNAEF